ncbi:mycosin-5-like [Lynx rufus]|uniref:mycosin-5-like n=1 Tax=Lynx rufus TaxID=61384 RepID=UPI001F125DCB|nr:mycosin-5-like [Lynx rufus]
MGGGSTPVPQPTPAPPSGEPRSSQGGPGSSCQLGGSLKKSLRNSGVLRAPPNLRAPRKTSAAPPRALGVMAKWLPSDSQSSLLRQFMKGSCGVNPFPSTDGGDGPGGPHPSHRPPPAPGRW